MGIPKEYTVPDATGRHLQQHITPRAQSAQPRLTESTPFAREALLSSHNTGRQDMDCVLSHTQGERVMGGAGMGEA